MSGRRTVVITGAETPTGLTTARALKGMDIDIVGLTSNSSAPACRSSAWTRIISSNGNATEQLEYLVVLVKTGKLPSRSILLFSQDTHVTEASGQLEYLQAFFIVPIPSADIVEKLMDKTLFHQWATQQGLAVPVSAVVSRPEEAIAAVDSLSFPCILKPLVRTSAWDSRHSNRKFFRVGSQSELESILATEKPFEISARFVLQEWIEGTDEDVFFVLFAVAPGGRILAIQGGRKIWQWPPLGGSTALCCSCDDLDLIEKAKEVVAASGLIGLASVEFKRDVNTRQFLITEPTIGRNDYQSGLANGTSKNPTRLLVEYLLGQEVPGRVRVNQKRAVWVDEISCLRRIRQDGGLRPAFHLARVLLEGRRISLLWGAWSDWRPLQLSLASLGWRRRK